MGFDIAADNIGGGSGGTADALSTTGADVVVSGSAPGTAGQVLKLVSPTAAEWADEDAGGVADLQEAYDGGPGIVTDAGGTMSIGRILDDAIAPLTINKSPATGAAGAALVIIMGANATGPAIAADPDSDRSFVFGKAILDSRITDNVFLSHFAMTTIQQYALRQNSAGRTTLNAPIAQSIAFANNGADQFAVSSAGMTAIDADGPAMLNEASTELNPTVVPHRGDTTSGLGGVSGEPAIITSSLIAGRWDASQNYHAANHVYLGIDKRLITSDDGLSYIENDSNASMRFRVSNSAVLRLTSASVSVFGFQQILRNVNGNITGTVARGIELGAINSATALDPVKNSPVLELRGSAWNTNLLDDDSAAVSMQLRATSGATTTAGLFFRGQGGSGGAVEIGNLSAAGALALAAGLGVFGVTPPASAPAYTPANVTTDRTYNADATSTAELADVLGTLIADLQATGLLA